MLYLVFKNATHFEKYFSISFHLILHKRIKLTFQTILFCVFNDDLK